MFITPWPSAGALVLVAPVVAVGLDEVFAEDFAGGEFCDGDGGVVDEHEDPFASVFFSDSEVVHSPGATQCVFPSGVEPVDADQVVGGVGEGVRCGFDGCVVGVFGGVTVERPEGSFGVVSVLELL